MVAQRTLTPSILVRIQVPQPNKINYSQKIPTRLPEVTALPAAVISRGKGFNPALQRRLIRIYKSVALI
jgi:hypothetical protein